LLPEMFGSSNALRCRSCGLYHWRPTLKQDRRTLLVRQVRLIVA
jgi:hypothetical protein